MVVVTVPAGFPSPAEDAKDYVEGPLNLNEYLVSHPAATCYAWVKDNSMIGAGIYSGDLLIVDRSVLAQHGNIVIAVINGEFTVKRLHCVPTGIRLIPENPDYPPIQISNPANVQIWGVVTKAIHFFC